MDPVLPDAVLLPVLEFVLPVLVPVVEFLLLVLMDVCWEFPVLELLGVLTLVFPQETRLREMRENKRDCLIFFFIAFYPPK